MFSDEIESTLDYLIKDKKHTKLSLLVHPYLASYFTKGFISIQVKWFLKYKKWITVSAVSGNQLVEYSFLDKKNKKIRI